MSSDPVPGSETHWNLTPNRNSVVFVLSFALTRTGLLFASRSFTVPEMEKL